MRKLLFTATPTFAIAVLTITAQSPTAALTGTVSSDAEPVMEGVLVSAKKADSTVTVTVVDTIGRTTQGFTTVVLP